MLIDSHRYALRLSDLKKLPMFRAFRKEFEDAYIDRLDALARLSGERSGGALGVVLAGGGANLAFIREVASAGRPKSKNIRLKILQPDPRIVADKVMLEPDCLGLLPQLATSIGGAISPMPTRTLAKP